MQEIIATNHQVFGQDVVVVQTAPVPPSEFIKTLTPLLTQAGAKAQPSHAGLTVLLRAGQGRPFLNGLALLLTPRGIALRYAGQ